MSAERWGVAIATLRVNMSGGATRRDKKEQRKVKDDDKIQVISQLQNVN